MLKEELSLFIFFISFFIYKSKKTLVLLDGWNNVESNSLLWKQITNIGNEIDFKLAVDKDIKLNYFGEYLYDNIIFFAPTFTDTKKNEINIQNLLNNASKFMRELVNEFGVD